MASKGKRKRTDAGTVILAVLYAAFDHDGQTTGPLTCEAAAAVGRALDGYNDMTDPFCRAVHAAAADALDGMEYLETAGDGTAALIADLRGRIER